MPPLPSQHGKIVAATARACAFAATLLALVVAWSWMAGVNDLLTLSPEHVPMAPSTALALVLLGAVAMDKACRPSSRRQRASNRLAGLLVALVGAGVIARHLLGWGSPLEEWLSRTSERMNGVPLGQMSPLTGAFLLALSLALLLLEAPGRQPRGAAVLLAGMVALAAFGNAGSYLFGRPWLSDILRIPVAFSTGIDIGLIALATLGLALRPREGGAPAPPPRHADISWTVAVGLALIILLVGALYLRHEQAQARDGAHRLLESIGKLKADEIASWREERLNDARFFSSAPFVAKDVAAFFANPASLGTRREVMSWLTLLKGGRRYSAVTLLDGNANPRLSVDEPRLAVDLPREVMAQALARGEPVMSDLRHEADGVHMDVVFPILGPPDPSGRRASLASLVLCIDPRRFLFPLLQSWPTPSRTAETVLFGRRGDEVVFLNDLRHRTNSALDLRFPLAWDSTLPAVAALRGRTGILEGNDYRGVPVLASARPVGGSPWHVIAKVDREELYGSLRQQAWLTLATTLLLALATALMVRVSWDRRTRAGERERLALAERYRVLFETMRNGFALCRMVYEGEKPVDFVYLAVNPAFEILTGLKDVVGKRVTQVIPGILQTNPELFEVYGRVARTGKPEQFETFVPGLGIWFSVSANSSETGTFAAFFENITQRKAQEKEISRLTRLYATLSQINQAIVRVRSREELFREVCRVTAEFSGFALAWVGWLDTATRRVLPVGSAGPCTAYLRDIAVFADDCPEGRGPVGLCIREQRTCIFNDFANDPRSKAWHAAAQVHGLKSAAAMPIRHGGAACGAFVVYTDETNVFQDREVALLEEAAMDISFALDHLAEEEKRKAAEAELQQHRDLLEQTGRIASVGGWEVDVATGKAFWTEEVARIHDLPLDTRPSMEIGLSFYTEESRPCIARAVREAIESGKPYDLECELVSAKGTRKWVHTIGHPVVEGGKVVKLRGSLQDITQLKKAERSLVESEVRFRAIFESATLGIAQADPKTGRFLLVNPRMCEITGYSAEELLRLTVPEITHPEDRGHDWQLFEDVVAGRSPDYQVEKRYVRKDGSIAWVNINMTVIRDAAGRPSRTLAAIEDIREKKRAEEALRESERRLRLSQRAARAGSWEWDLRTNENIWSEELWRVYGIEPNSCEPSYEAWLEMVHPDDREPASRAVQAAAARGTDLSVEWRIRDANGSSRWLLSLGQPLRDAEGNAARYLGIVLDITERKRAEEEREIHAKLLGLLNASNNLHELMRGVTHLLKEWLGSDAVGIRLQEGDDFPYFETRGFPSEFVRMENQLCALDPQGRVLRDAEGHPVLECMCGNVLRRRFDASKPFFTERGSFWTNGTTELLASTTEEDRQARTRNRCNTEGYESMALIALRVGENTYGLLQVNARRKNLFLPGRVALLERLADSLAVGIAHRKGQATLGESEQRLRFALETSHTGAWDLDLADHSAFRSLEHDRIFGYAELLPSWTYEQFLEHVLPEDRAEVDGKFRRALETRGEWNFECRIRRADGEVRWIWAAGCHRADAGGKALRMAGIVQDITERKKAAEVIESTNRQLAEAMAQLKATQQQLIQQERLHALGQMASGIAHDFNNALMPILGFTELLLKRPDRLDDKRRIQRTLRLIQTAASDAAQVVRRLREFYRRRERGEVFLPLDVNSLVRETIELTRPRWEKQSEATGIAICVKTAFEDIPTIYGNEAELREALTNLIFNAVDSMPHGGTLTLGTRADGDLVRLSVSDTGTGMAEEVRRRCLEPFFSTKGEHGTGLGLSMVHGIIRRHEGALEVDSAPGKGSTFSISLPVGSGTAAGDVAGGERPAPSSWKILVADDDPRLRDMLLQDLGEEGHRVETAPDGLEAEKRVRHGGFDLVITDRAMPGMSGDQLAELIKRESPATKVVLLTGFGDIMKARGEHPSCIDLVVSKPISLEKLRVALGRLMQATGDAPPAQRKRRTAGRKPRARRGS